VDRHRGKRTLVHAHSLTSRACRNVAGSLRFREHG
jgi:hypothetical protein